MEMSRTECLSPFDIDMILEVIFKALPSAALVRARLVSKRWEGVASRALKKRRDLVIKLNCKTIQEFASRMETSWSLPFPCYDLNCVYYGEENFLKFVQVCGDCVKTLRFNLTEDCRRFRVGQLPVGEDFLRVIFELGNTLEVLEFELLPFSGSSKIKVKVTTEGCNRKIVNMSMSNGAIEIDCVPQNFEFFYGYLSTTLRFTRELQEVDIYSLRSLGILNLVKIDQLRLTKLRLSSTNEQVLQELLDSSIVLEEFEGCLTAEESYLDLFTSFLNMQRKSLKVLSLNHMEFWKIGQKFPIMPELTELAISGSRCNESVVQFLRLERQDLLRGLPKLRSLSLSSTLIPASFYQFDRIYLESLFSEHLPVIVPFGRLESLRISLRKVALGIQYFGERFPNIRKLSLSSATSAMCRGLFEVGDWGLNLKELKIDFGKSVPGDMDNESRDCGICGFTSEWRRDVGMKLLMNKDQGAILREAETWNRGTVGSGGGRGISRFQYLEKLSIEESVSKMGMVKPNHVHIAISDLVVYFSLVNLSHLRSLSIHCGNLVTPGAVQYLKTTCPILCSVVIKPPKLCL